jgi:bla regulator protein blaR1
MQGGAAAPLNLLIQLAYDVNEFQILGVPSWANADRYDVEARAGGATTLAQMRPMLQSLLAERFKLTLHRETRPLPVYELMPAGNGLKIVPMKEGGCVPMEQAKPFEPLNICGGVRRQIAGVAPERRDVIEAVGVRMPKLLEFVSEEVGRVVLDKTGFTELFNFRLEFASNLASGLVVPDAAAASSTGLSIFTALDEQLGMRLRAATGPVEVLVIDRVERPSPN